jgi:hypothetical protein
MKDNTMALLWDGYIQTPFIEFKKGDYVMEFQAKGSGAKEEFSKLKIEFEIPDKNNYLCTTASIYIELTGKMETYPMDFQTTANTMGRIRITYFNDIYIPETGEGRDVWIREIMISCDLNEKFLEVRKPFFKKVFGRRRQKLAVDLGNN